MDFTLKQLQDYLVRAQALHAHGTADVTKDPGSGAMVIKHSAGDWSFTDAFYGGQPYGGQETIFYKGKAVWIMVYYGNVYDTKLKSDEIYAFLRKSLQFPPADAPFRGPAERSEGPLTYQNVSQGDVAEFNGKEIYSAVYFGGLVDQKPGGGF